VRSYPGGDRVVFIWAGRPDVIYRIEAFRKGALKLTADSFLRSDRTLTTFAAAFTGAGALAAGDVARCGADGLSCGFSPCRAPSTTSVIADELFGAIGTTNGCGRVYDGTSNKERGARITDGIEAISPGLSDNVAYYLARPDASAKVFYPLGALANLNDAATRAVEVERCRLMTLSGFAGCEDPNKDHYWWDPNNKESLEYTVGIGDGHSDGYRIGAGGDASPNCDVDTPVVADDPNLLDTLTDIYECETVFTGLPEYPNGTRKAWTHEAQDRIALSADKDAAGLGSFVYVNPNWLAGCPKTVAEWDSIATMEDLACLDIYDDPTTGVNEAALVRMRVMYADWAVIVLGNQAPTSDNIGSGGISGFTYDELSKLIQSLPSPDGTPPIVTSWHGGTNDQNLAWPPKLNGLPEDNPPSDLPVCGDGVTEGHEECDDGNATSGDGCSSKCLLPWAFVVAGQSNQTSLVSTQDLDSAAAHVTSPDPLYGGISRTFRWRHTFDGSGWATWTKLNDFPCADDQCTGTECTGTNRTGAGHPDTNAGDGDGTCSCDCGASSTSMGGAEFGSAWPAFARRIMQDTGHEVEIVFVARGGTSLVWTGGASAFEPLWSPNVDCTGRVFNSLADYDDQTGDLYCGIFEAVSDSGTTARLKAMLWLQGENDAAGAISGAAYKAALKTLADNVHARLGIPTIAAPISKREFAGDAFATHPEGNVYDVIHDATEEAIAENAHLFMGPDTDDLKMEDGVHIQDVATMGIRWAEAVRAQMNGQSYDGGAP
jgi:cysteine-rich repeat protein